MARCTWKNCSNEAVMEELDRDGRRWAYLCHPHHDELETAIKSMNAKAVMQAWVRAKGGAEAFAKDMVESLTYQKPPAALARFLSRNNKAPGS